MNQNVHRALETVSSETGIDVRMEVNRLLVAGKPVNLPIEKQGDDRPRLTGERAELMGIQGLIPTVPHGDDRDKLLWRVIQEAAPESDVWLNDLNALPDLPARLGLGPEASRAAAKALEARFFSARGAQRLLPVHASLPLNYEHSALHVKTATPRRIPYTMFGGGILPYLLWNSETGGPDVDLMQALLDAVASDDELTTLDRLFLKVMLDGAPRPSCRPSATELLDRYREEYGAGFASAGGPFCEPSLALFERDLKTVLDTELPRPERARWLTVVLSFHLALRLYRIAVAVGSDLDMAVAAAAQIAPPSDARVCTCTGRDIAQLDSCSLAGAIRFRIGSGRFRPVSGSDGCRRSYQEVDRRRLLDMPASLVTRTLACRAWSALGGGEMADRQDVAALAQALDADAELRRAHGAACAAIAVLHHDGWRRGRATLEELERAGRTGKGRPGLHALRDDIRHMRSRPSRQGTEVVNQLMLAPSVGPGSLISRNGPSFAYFELDEQLLLMLVRLTCGDRELPLESFLQALRSYGLAPQDDAERAALADTLERLGLLDRYSDAGEASFVHYA
jgi:hypothetical protein